MQDYASTVETVGIVGAVIHRNRSGEAEHECLRGVVKGHTGIGMAGADGADIDDDASPAGGHQRNELAAGAKDALRINTHDQIPVLVTAVDNCLLHLYAGVVDQYVDPPEQPPRLQGKGRDTIGASYID